MPPECGEAVKQGAFMKKYMKNWHYISAGETLEI